MGSHSELMTLEGAYYNMVKSQGITDTGDSDGKVLVKQFINT